MKKLSFLNLLLCTSLSYSENINVHIFSGQSNTSGYGKFNDALEYTRIAATDLQIRYYYHVDPTSRNWTSTTFGTLYDFYLANEESRLAGTGRWRFGAEVMYGRLMHEYDPSGTTAMIKVSQGSSSLATDWNSRLEGDNNWELWQSEVTNALSQLEAEGHTVNIASIIWVQGENDAVFEDQSAAYEVNFTNLIDDMYSFLNGLGYSTENTIFMNGSFSENKPRVSGRLLQLPKSML